MRIGDLDRRVKIERKSIARSASGAAAETWALLAWVWAGKNESQGREWYAARQLQANRPAQFRLRWGVDVTVEDRIVDGALVYDVTAIVEVGRREGQLVYADAKAEGES